MAWGRIGLLVVLFAAAFWESLYRLLLKTNPYNGDANWQHSFFVPLIGVYYLYLNRESVLKTPVRTAWTGLPILLVGLLTYAYGIWPGQNAFIMDCGALVALFGLVLLVCGWAMMGVVWFPILFLVCAIPWPATVYSLVAMPLQKLAASAAVLTLSATGVEAVRNGTTLVIGAPPTQRVLNVAEACAGLKSLMTFITVAAALAFLARRALWQRLVITFSAIPIAVFCNMMRVAGQGLLDRYVSEKLSESFAHQFVGLVMLIPAVFMIQFVAWFLDNVFEEEGDGRGSAKARGAGAKRLVIEVPRATAKGPETKAAAEAGVTRSAAEDLAAATERLRAASLRPRQSKGTEGSGQAGEQTPEGQ
ncbi:MAG TPA: exosortase/archaeosortase family protein [Tepidisphaeraceae bacterium]|nr:exosortase/archaeosortase family protein [Tepidisphaeraceae bacterium]